MAMSTLMRPLLGLAAAALVHMSAAETALSDADVREFHKKLDLDGDKHVSLSEMTEFAKLSAKDSSMGLATELETMLNGLPSDLRGSPVLMEYLAVHKASVQYASDGGADGLEFMMMMLDMNQDKSVDLDEFHLTHETPNGPDPEVAKSETERFNAADTNGDGKLNAEELALMLLPEALTAAHVKADKDGDGQLSYDEMSADLLMAQFSALPEKDKDTEEL